jgi:restriction endonuclease S subunit
MSALVEENLEDYIFPDKVIRVRPRLDEIEPEYLWLVLQLPHIRIQIEAAARTAVGNYAIGGSDVWNFKIPLPPLDIQRGLVETVRKRRAKVRRLRAEATKREEAARERLEAIILGTEPPPS